MRLKIMASVALLSVFSTSYAKVIYDSGDWELDDLSTKTDPNASCRIMSTKNKGGADWSFEFVHAKNKASPTEIYLRKQGKGASSWTAVLASGETVSFANSGLVGKVDMLWNIPQDSQSIVEHLDDRNKILFKPADGSKDIKLEFSGRGFKEVRLEMMKRCLQGSPLIDMGFEHAFLLKKDALDPSKLSLDTVKELRRLLYVGHGVHLNILGNQGSMSDLRARFQNQLNESNAMNTLIDRLTTRDIPQIKANIDANESLDVSKKAELVNIKNVIKGQQASIASAEKTLDSAKDAIAPFEQEHNGRLGNSENARSVVSQLAGRLNSIDQGISQANLRLSQLDNEAGNLQNSSSRLDNDLRMARMERGRAEQNARSFNPQFESRRRLSMDRMYQDSLRDVGPIERTLESLDRALVDARSKVLAREAELRVCQSRTGYVSQDSYRLPAQERQRPGGRPGNDGDDNNNRPGRPGNDGNDNNNRPGRPGNDGNDNNNRPTPPSNPEPTPGPVPSTPSVPSVPSTPSVPTGPDCSAQINAVNTAKLVESDLLNQQRDQRQRLQSSRSRVNMIENRIMNEIEAERKDLVARANMAQRRAEDIENQLNSNVRRIDIISRVEMPQQQSILYSLQNERPGVQAQYDQAVPNSNRLAGELANFERKVGWDGKVEAVQTATATLSSRKNDLYRSETTQNAIESTIASCASERARLNDSLTARINQKAQSEARLVQVTKALEPFEAEKLKIEANGSDLKNQLSGIATEFENQIR